MKIAKLILDYNNHELTRNLLNTFPDAIVIDNGSALPFEGTHVIRFDKNLGFTEGWNEAVRRVWNEYDAFMLMNNDIITTPDMFDAIKWVLENKPRLGMVSPFCNSPHEHMHKKSPHALRYVPFVELVCPTIRKTAFQSAGLFDDLFSKGWGLDYDFGWKVRRAGFSVGVFDLVGINHLEHKTIDIVGRDQYFREASHEMNTILTQRYGDKWERDLTDMIAITMVVCNEEKRLNDFFDYHAHLADEISVAVQESVDHTLEICMQRADTVLPTKKVGYCEADRDRISVVTNSDWQLCLDPDEYLTPKFIEVYRKIINDGPKGYRLTRRLIEDGIFRFEGDQHHRFYHRSNVKFLDELHTEPQAKDWNLVSSLPFTSIDHIKTLNETIEDEMRYEEVIETKYKDHPTYSAKKALNIHIRGKENNQ